jgi:hypothetical protein
MLDVAVALFALAAVAGLSMAIMHFRGHTPPRPVLAVFHGLFAASGLLVLIIAVTTGHMTGIALIALGLLVLAALGGFGLLSYHLRGRALSGGFIVGHALLAVAGFVVLLASVFIL